MKTKRKQINQKRGPYHFESERGVCWMVETSIKLHLEGWQEII